MADDAIPTGDGAPSDEGGGQAPAGPDISQVVAAVEALAGQVQALSQKVNQAPAPAPAPAAAAAAPAADEPSADDLVAEFARDPRGTIKRFAKEDAAEVFEQRAGPGLVRMLQQNRDDALEGMRQRVDADFGPGYFDEALLPKLVTGDRANPGILDRLSLWQQADKQVVGATVQGLIGEQFMRDRPGLLDRLTKATNERKAQEPPVAPAPGVRPPLDHDGRIPTELKDGIRRLQEEGVDFSEEDYRHAIRAGKTLDGWLAAAKPQGGRQ